MEKIGYLGPEGSYSLIAARNLCEKAQHIPYPSFPLVMASLVSGETDGIVLPIENSLSGGVMQNIDLLQYTPNVCAVREYTVKIDHRLVIKAGADKNNIERIYSHSQALEQCAGYLAKHFPMAKLISTASTAASLDMIKTPNDAGIAGAHNRREGFDFSDRNVADEENNFTHFLLIRRGSVPENLTSSRIYFSVECPNKSGALLSLLQCVYKGGFNMTKLQSRPVRNAPETYRFFIETEGDYSDAKIKSALKEIERSAISFKLLGCY